MLVAIWAMVNRREALAGLAVGALLYKPSAALAFVVLLLVRKEWRALALCSLAGIGWFFLSVLAAHGNLGWVSQYAHLVRQSSIGEFAGNSHKTYTIPTLLLSAGAPITLAVAAAIAVFASRDPAICLSAGTRSVEHGGSGRGWPTGLHAWPYEATLLLPAVFYGMAKVSEPWRTRSVVAAYLVAALALSLPHAGHGLALLAIGAPAWWLWNEYRKPWRSGTIREAPSGTTYEPISCLLRIPTYRARNTICDVVRGVLPFVSHVIVVDDACPEGSGDVVNQTFGRHPSLYLLRRPGNGGVGAAMKTGFEKALELEADVIVKIDADGQMDPTYIPGLVQLFESDPALAYVKGNRFFDSRVLSRMPALRLFGNSCLSLMAKFASGYWNILDPTNGYLAFSGHLLPAVNWRSFADCYFFEISALCEFGLKRGTIAEMEMETFYGQEPSSLSISRTLFRFPPRLAWLFVRRVLLQYYLFDINLGSLYILLGLALTGFGTGLAIFEWVQSALTGIPRTTGTVMLAVLPFLMGFQLVLNALLFDVQFSAKSSRETLGRVARGEERRLHVGSQ